MKYFANGIVFVVVYLIFMIPTYLLPYLGSNSAVVTGLGVAAEQGMSPQQIMHLASLAVLIGVTWLRGSYVKKNWLIILPIIAAVFDMMPGLNLVPFVPTVMHVFVLIKGIASSPENTTVSTENT